MSDISRTCYQNREMAFLGIWRQSLVNINLFLVSKKTFLDFQGKLVIYTGLTPLSKERKDFFNKSCFSDTVLEISDIRYTVKSVRSELEAIDLKLLLWINFAWIWACIEYFNDPTSKMPEIYVPGFLRHVLVESNRCPRDDPNGMISNSEVPR